MPAALSSETDVVTRGRLRLALRLLGRDWRAGELRLFAGALIIAVGAVTAVGFFNDRVTRGMTQQSAELLGADLILTSPQPVAQALLEPAAARGLRRAEAIEFPSVVLRGEKLQLASVRAVGSGFPLRGALRTASVLYGPDEATHDIPQPGTAWVEARVMHALALAIGDTLQLGATQFTVTRVLTYEPGRTGNFFALAPRVLIHRDDITRTQVIQPGSRVTYGYGFAGAEAPVRAYQDWLQTRLEANHQLFDVREGNATVARAVDRVDRYIGLTSLLAVILAGVAIAMGARRYTARHYDMSAMLRCLGASQRDIVLLYLPPLFLFGLLASLAGIALGWVAQWVINLLMQGFFPLALPLPGLAPAAYGLLTGLITLAGFAVAPVLRLKSVPPLRVLRRELTPLPASAWAVYGSAAAAMVALMWRYTGNWTLTFGVLAGSAAAAGLLALAAVGLLRLSRRLPRGVGVAWRFGLGNLWRRARSSVGQILAFGLTLMAMALIALLRSDLITSWERQLPPDTPNHFVFNILKTDVEPLHAFFRKQNIESQAIYPMVRGRLVAIDGVPVTQAVTKEERNNEALNRELNLSWASAVPPDNAILHGSWWQAGQGPAVSVEEKLAKRIGIDLGSELEFSIGGELLKVRVASIRSVQWDSFHPNFFMLFPPGLLDHLPATYLTSFHLTPAQKPLLTPLVRAFPAVTVLETDQVLAQMRAILQQVTLTVEFVLLFVLAAGFAVLYAALATSLDERFHEGALLRALGASRRQLRTGHLSEFAALGALAGLLAAIGTELIAYLLYVRVFDLDYSFKWPVWILAPLAGCLLIGLAGYIGTRRVVDRSPLQVLRET